MILVDVLIFKDKDPEKTLIRMREKSRIQIRNTA